MLAKFVAGLIVGFARFITAVRGKWEGIEPVDGQRIYFANHARRRRSKASSAAP